MGILSEHGIEWVYHYTPLHYLPFIARSQSVLSKPELAQAGFAESHLRSKSSKSDIQRGFGGLVHLTIDNFPRLLRAKLAAGFPHIALAIPVDNVDVIDFSLCRYNVAMTRYLRRNGNPGFPESSSNGRYQGSRQIPTANTDIDKAGMLESYLDSSTMIEVLVPGKLILSNDICIICYDDNDLAIINKVLKDTGVGWSVNLKNPHGNYARKQLYVDSVEDFITIALSDTEWRGNGLEFDRV